jgi:flagellar hook-associated protein 1
MAVQRGSEVAAANPVQVTMPATNLGSLVVDDLAVVAGLPPAPLRDPNLTNAVSVVFTSASAYEIRSGATVLSSGTYSSGGTIAFNGWSMTVRGTPSPNDTLNLGANVGGIGDNRNALKLAALAGRQLIDGASITGGFANTIARLGGAAEGASVFSLAQDAIRENAVAAESAAGGVNLDEEATKLIQYQQQYQAAAKIIAVGRTIFDEILALGR